MATPTPFSKRLYDLPLVAHEPPLAGPKRGRAVLAIKDQLLVSTQTVQAHAAFASALAARGWVEADEVPVLYGVQLYWHPGAFDHNENVFTHTQALRSALSAKQRNDVSPNHVLVPSMLGHSCPAGPPSPIPGNPTLPPMPGGAQVPVTIIDSGYQWDDKRWSPNPLGGRITERECDWVMQNGLQPGVPDQPGETVPGPGPPRLCALAGHANFIAGLVIQECPSAHVTIANHNGSYQPAAVDYPTEYSVVNALKEAVASAGPNKAKLVIDLGYAFTATANVPSVLWTNAFTAIGPGPIIVSPAGNYGPAATAYYPAAFGKSFDNVIGVASLRPASGGAPSPFTNRGEWVKCSVVGEQLRSTFLDLQMRLEDGPGANPPVLGNVDFRSNSWARWDGTSFAAARLVGMIANRLAQSLAAAAPLAAAPSAAAAWQAVLATSNVARDPNLGYKIPPF